MNNISVISSKNIDNKEAQTIHQVNLLNFFFSGGLLDKVSGEDKNKMLKTYREVYGFKAENITSAMKSFSIKKLDMPKLGYDYSLGIATYDEKGAVKDLDVCVTTFPVEKSSATRFIFDNYKYGTVKENVKVEKIQIEKHETDPSTPELLNVKINFSATSFDALFRARIFSLLNPVEENEPSPGSRTIFLQVSTGFCLATKEKNLKHKELKNLSDMSSIMAKMSYVNHKLTFGEKGKINIEAEYISYHDNYTKSASRLVFSTRKDVQEKLRKLTYSSDNIENKSLLKKEIIQNTGNSPKSRDQIMSYIVDNRLIREVDVRQTAEERGDVQIYEIIDADNPEYQQDKKAKLLYVLFGDLLKSLDDFYSEVFAEDNNLNLAYGSLVCSRLIKSSSVDEQDSYTYGLAFGSSPVEREIGNIPISLDVLKGILDNLDRQETLISVGNIFDAIYESLGEVFSHYKNNLKEVGTSLGISSDNLTIPDFSYASANLNNEALVQYYNHVKNGSYERTKQIKKRLNGEFAKEFKNTIYIFDKKSIVRKEAPIKFSRSTSKLYGESNRNSDYINFIQKLSFDPIEPDLRDSYLVSEYKNQPLSLYDTTNGDVLKYTRTIYTVKMDTYHAGFISPGMIIQLDETCFPTLYNSPDFHGNRKTEKDESEKFDSQRKSLLKLLNQKFIVTKVTHTLTPKLGEHFTTNIEASPVGNLI